QDAIDPLVPGGGHGLLDLDVDDGLLEGGREVLDAYTPAFRALAANMADDGGLEPRQREVVPLAFQGAREPDRLRVPLRGVPVDLRPPRIPQPEEPPDLVEGLARGVVDGLS